MNLLNYLQKNEKITPHAASALRDEATKQKRSIYQHAYTTIQKQPYGFDYAVLEETMLAEGADAGYPIVALNNTRGYSVVAKIYEAAGGASQALANLFIPIMEETTGKHICVTTRPDDTTFIDKLHNFYGDWSFEIGICSREIYKALLDLYATPLIISSSAKQMFGDQSNKRAGPTSNDSAIRQLYHQIFKVGYDRRASDVHLIPCHDYAQIFYRIDGHNHHYTDIPIDTLFRIFNLLVSDSKAGNKNDQEIIDSKMEFSPSEGKIPDDRVDLRISIIPSKYGPDINVRYLSSRMFSFEELGMSAQHIALYQELLERPSGLIVQVGPTGSGKSTTLYTGLDYIHKSLRNIITIEDPVEIMMNGITQIDVQAKKTGQAVTFAEALKASLRHDPDVIVVGELRDAETAQHAIRAANTGHLVITSLHTNDSIGAFERLINLGIDPYSLGDVLVAVMGQRLVRRLCAHCREAYMMPMKSDVARMFKLPNMDTDLEFYNAVGCVHCNNVGYRGRVAINEILVIDKTLRDLIQQRAPRKEYEEYLLDDRKVKFRSMYHDGLHKVFAGITSLEEMRAFALDTIAFKGAQLERFE